jgi:hypothetical protein
MTPMTWWLQTTQAMRTASPSCARTAVHSPIEPLQRSRARYLRHVELDNPTPGRAGLHRRLPRRDRRQPAVPVSLPPSSAKVSAMVFVISAGVTVASGESEVREAIARLGREGYEVTRIVPPLEHAFSYAPRLLEAQPRRSSASGSFR